MASFVFEGLDAYAKQLEQLGQKSQAVIKMAVYEGGKVVADETRRQLVRAANKGFATGDLQRSLFLAKMRNDNGYIYTQIGFAGKDRKGVPNSIKARVLDSGSSHKGRAKNGHQRKTNFLKKAEKAAAPKAQAAMAAALDKAIEKMIGG